MAAKYTGLESSKGRPGVTLSQPSLMNLSPTLETVLALMGQW